MKTKKFFLFFALSIATTLNAQINGQWLLDGSFFNSITPSILISPEMEFDVEKALKMNKDKPEDWGIEGTLYGSGAYIKLTINYTLNGTTYIAGGIEYVTPAAPNIYSHKPLYNQCKEDPSVDFKWIHTSLTYANCADEVWNSSELNKIVHSIKKKQVLPFESAKKSFKVTLKLEIKDAILKKIYIPELGDEKFPWMLFEGSGRKGVVVRVDRENGSLLPSFYDFTFSSIGSVNDISTDVVELTAGERVTYEIYGNRLNQQPIIKGVPKIWASGYAAQREFVTTPDYGPNQYHPWIAYEAQTHFRLINTYPKAFEESGIKTEDWKTNGISKSWEWVAQRRTDPAKDTYQPIVYYPKVRKFKLNSSGDYKYQRESQALGWSKQVMEYYDKYTSAEGLGNEKYLTGFDVDEFLYVGSKIPEAPEVNGWITAAQSENPAYTYPHILSVHNYSVPVFRDNASTGSTSNNNNWQNMWDSEKTAKYESTSSNIGDVVIYNVPEENEYPLAWDNRGFPKFGFLLNDMITRYQKYKTEHDNNSKTDLSPNYYYNGYEIQDTESHKLLNNGSMQPISRVNNKPSPCGEGCWFEGNSGGENIKHPGKVEVKIKTEIDQEITISFKQKVTVPIDNVANTNKGFYSSLQAENEQAMGYGNKNIYTLHGVENEAMAKRISLVMLTYDAGNGMMLRDTVKILNKGDYNLSNGKIIDKKYAAYDSNNKTLSASFNVSSGWMAIAAYYKTRDLKDSIIIAGRVPMVMDPPTSLTVPGSDPFPYASTSLAIDGSLDLKEGQGDRAFETMNEVRVTIDPGRGYVHKLGEAYTKYVREYNIVKDNKLTFSCLDVGRKIESFWTDNNEDPYQSWREMAKRMRSDLAASKLQWKVFKIPDDGTAPQLISGPTYKRHLTHQFNEIGNYEVQVTWKDAKAFTPTKVLVRVENPPIGDYTNLTDEIERGKIKMRRLTLEEKRWIKEYTKNSDGTTYSGSDSAELENLDQYMIAEVDEILSDYAYALGPRASIPDNKPHREGLWRDFNAFFEWKLVVDSNVSLLNNPAFIKNGFMNKDMSTLLWPDSWGKTWLYHNPTKGTTAPVTAKNEVLRDGSDVSISFNNTMGEAFTKLDEAQGNILPWIRWFPWIAISPTNGYKINRYIKTTLNLPLFLSNENTDINGNTLPETGQGLFSGKAKTKVGDVGNAIENMMWFDYGSPEAAFPSQKEMDRHLSDEKKNLMEFYNDLKYGRKVIFKSAVHTQPIRNIVVYNLNRVFNATADGNGSYPKVNSNLPEKIYIAGAIVTDSVINNHNTIAGIPLLHFDGARFNQKNALNGTYNVTGANTSIIHNGVVKTLQITANNWSSDIPVKMVVNIPSKLTENTAEDANRISPTPHIYGFKVKLQNKLNTALKVTLSVLNSDSQIQPMNTINQYTLQNGSNGIIVNLPSVYTSAPKKFVIEVFKTDNTLITAAPVIEIESISILDIPGDSTMLFVPSANDEEFLSWLAESSYRFFDWNYIQINSNEGVFLETSDPCDEIENITAKMTCMKNKEKVSLSGQGMGIAVTLLAEQAGYLNATVAKERIKSVLNWLEIIQNKSLGNANMANRTGWHGIPTHYLNLDGSVYNPPLEDHPNGIEFPIAVSTIDWAMCAQGIRLARQRYADDGFIKEICTKLLMRVNWNKFKMPDNPKLPEMSENQKEHLFNKNEDGTTTFKNAGRIVFDLQAKNGEINPRGNAWGQDFSEESELVYLEALASNNENKYINYNPSNLVTIEIDKVIYTQKTKEEDGTFSFRDIKVIDRKCKDGFIPSYFGSGFTYNWLQLWYGSRELSTFGFPGSPNWNWALWGTTAYYYNSQKAYEADYLTAKTQFLGEPYMGLTAASTISEINNNGFVTYGKYISNQGADKHLAPQGGVIQVAPAPYGAVLALPFDKPKAMEALRAYTNLGYYHQYMGLPDNIVFEGTGSLGILPNWNQLDINIAPIAMAIDLLDNRNKFIPNQLVNDKYAMHALYDLYNSFSNDYNNCPSTSNRITGDKPEEVSLEEISLENEELLENNILLYPNPNTGKFTLKFNIAEPGVYQGTFMNLQGRIFSKDQWEFDSAGNHEVLFDGLGQQGLMPGIYVMVIKGSGIEKSIKVLVKNK